MFSQETNKSCLLNSGTLFDNTEFAINNFEQAPGFQIPPAWVSDGPIQSLFGREHFWAVRGPETRTESPGQSCFVIVPES